jgi:hypothetical protein
MTHLFDLTGKVAVVTGASAITGALLPVDGVNLAMNTGRQVLGFGAGEYAAEGRARKIAAG